MRLQLEVSAIATLTITEAFAELKTIGKRLESKRQSIAPYLWRQEGIKDPLLKEYPEGGSEEFIKRERQAIGDLETRHIAIRLAIEARNLATSLTVEVAPDDTETRTIQGWLVWRKEVVMPRQQWLAGMRKTIQTTRQNAMQKGLAVLKVEEVSNSKDLRDIIINVSEVELAKEMERNEIILGQLDGKLSLLNATTTIEV